MSAFAMSAAPARAPSRVSRRALCTLATGAVAARLVRAVRAADPIDIDEKPVLVELGDGLRAEEVAVGSGAEVVPGSVVSVRWVLRRSNGYFIDASYGFGRFEELTYTAGTGAVVEGFERALLGMRAGGRRRFVCPPELGYAPRGIAAGAPGPIPPDGSARRAIRSHMRENLFFEVHATKVRAPRA